MDWDRLEGDWKQLRGKAKERWGKLTDDDLTTISGRRAQLEGKIQERYGYAKGQARKEIEDWYRSTDSHLADEIDNIRTLGGEVKDLDSGLVDFPGKRGSEEILLCWKLGEKHIGYWHPVDAGFAGRRPIDEQIPRVPQRLD